MLENDLNKIIKVAKTGKCKSVLLFGAYAKKEGYLDNGKPVNDLDIVVLDADRDTFSRFKAISTSVPLDVIFIQSSDLNDLQPTQIWWEISRASILLYGEPIKFPNWKAWEIPYWDAIASLDKRTVSMIIAKYEMMKEQPNWNKVMTQIGKMIIAIGDAILIKRGRFDHRYSIRNLMLMHDEVSKDYNLAVSHKILNEPELNPDEIWQMWMRTANRVRTYVIENEVNVPKLDILLAINETTTFEELTEIVKKLSGDQWL